MLGCITVIVMIIVSVLIYPILSFFGGWVTGLILEWVVGGMVTNGLNLLFNTTRFSADMLPIICGALAIVGSFFKSSLSASKKD